MQMTFDQAMRPGILQAFALKKNSGYVMRSEKRPGYASGGKGGGKRKPPKKPKAGKKKVTLAWKKKGYTVTKYQIYRSTKKNKGFKKVATVKGTVNKKALKAKSGKVYYYRVRGYFTMPHKHTNSKTYYTKWSKVFKAKAK